MTKRSRVLLLAGAGALAVAGASAAVLVARRAPAPRQRSGKVIDLAVAEVAPQPSVWVDVHQPAAVWRALRQNAWLARVRGEPLGRGLAGGWAPFLGTSGEEVGGGFRGAVADTLSEQLLADPFRVVAYTGDGTTGAPAILVPRPSRAARAAYEVLDAALGKGDYQAPRCPGPAPADPGKAQPVAVARWRVAEQSLFAGQRDGRLALGKDPVAVVEALCAAPPETPAEDGAALTLSFAPAALGREAQLGAALLGMGAAPRLPFALVGDQLVPRGLADRLAGAGRLATAPPPRPLLQLLPADAGVVLLATLDLPEPLDRASLAAHLQGAWKGARRPRPVAVVWNPRGAEGRPTEVAVLWPEGDRALLDDAFSGPNRVVRRRACGHEVLASSAELAAALGDACRGARPSLLHGPPAVADGLAQPASVALGVNLGVVLSRLLGDAYQAESKAPAAEVEAARRLLEELPFLGARGVVRGDALVPGGFRS